MAKYIIFTDGKEKLIDLGFEKIGKYGYVFPVQKYNNYITFYESKYKENEYILDITDLGFPNNENTYENLYNFILENKDKDNEFWSYNRELENGIKLNGLPKYFLDSKDGSVVSKEVKKEHLIYLSSLLKIKDTWREDRTFYALSKEQIINPLIKILEYLKLEDL